MIQIKAAALLSKYYSESAKQVDMIFSSLQQMCEDDSDEFVCVLIDEVENIASAREASEHGASQESLRATNSFLTGLDRTKKYPNIVFLCTSNMIQSLDAAFLDRCGLRYKVGLPPLASQYAILRGRIQNLITRGIVLSEMILPVYRDAEQERRVDPELPGSKILQILKLIKSTSESSGESISGRSLTQLPEQALLRRLRGEDCHLNMAFKLIEQYVKADQTSAEEGESDNDDEEEEQLNEILQGANRILETKEKILTEVGHGSRKRNASMAYKEDHMIDHALEVLGECLGVMGELVAGLRKQDHRGLPPEDLKEEAD